MHLTKGFVLLLSAALAGCASLSKEECLTADWHAIGYEDGARGEQRSQVAAHRKACAEYRVRPDMREYREGYDEGLESFCTASTGYSRALNGYEYTGICPGLLEADFLEGYTSGREIYQASSDVQALESQQQQNRSQREHLKETLREKESLLFEADQSEQVRRKVYREIAQLNERLGSLAREQEVLIRRLHDAESRLQELRSQATFY